MDWNEELMSIVRPEPVENGLSAAVQERAKVFGKWMWIYFWINIASIVPGIIALVEEQARTGTIIGTAIGWCFSAALVYAMFRLGRVQDRLKTSAGLSVITLAAQIILHFVNSEVVSDFWAIPGLIIGLIGEYHFMHGCGDALYGVDNELADRWYGLWKWYIGLGIGGLLTVPLLAVLIFAIDNAMLIIIFVIALLGWVAAVIAQVIRQLVYIYRTAKIFRGIAANL